MTSLYLHSLTSNKLPPCAGSKGANLHFLHRQGCRVPAGWVIPWTAREAYLQDPAGTRAAITSALGSVMEPGKRYAVRSSASVEDSGGFSCAGLFKSYLDVEGADQGMDYVLKVWDSLDSPEFQSYWDAIKDAGDVPRMAVVLQEMVDARCSGVLFTRNPVTGFAETILEAGPGTGEFQTGSPRDPERWVRKWGAWSARPDQGLLEEPLALEIAAAGQELGRRFKRPADLEWAWDGEQVYFLQIRPITRLDIPVYSNRIAKEMLPGVVKPLVWSVNTRLINPTWAGILHRLTGDASLDPESLTGHFYFRAYFNMAAFAKVFERLGMPGEALELLYGLEADGPEKPHLKPGRRILTRLPRLAAFAFGVIGISGKLKRLVRHKKPVYAGLAEAIEGEDDPSRLLALASRIFDETREVAYFNIMIPLLAMMYHRFLGVLLKKQGVDGRLLDLSPAGAERVEPQQALRNLHDRYYGNDGNDGNVGNDGKDAAPEMRRTDPERDAALERDIAEFLEAYGHFSDSGNDCSSIPWRETPDLIRRMVAQPRKAEAHTPGLLRFEELRLRGPGRLAAGFVYRRASRFAAGRDAISSLYTYGYGQFRSCFLRIGEHLAGMGVLRDREDVFYLYWHELDELLSEEAPQSRQALVAARRKEIESYEDAALPDLIIGDRQPPVCRDALVSLRGIPTSLGTYAGPARVIHGLHEFEKLRDGDVLVIPFSDVGWIPLFSKAGAVVAESGGILSHSSIIAREYRIPAVVSVSGACRLEDGTLIEVNGHTGEIRLVERR